MLATRSRRGEYPGVIVHRDLGIPSRTIDHMTGWCRAVLLMAAGLACAIAGCRGPEPVWTWYHAGARALVLSRVSTVSLHPCSLRSLFGVLTLCGTYDVWENRAAQAGRRIPLHLVVLPATGRAPDADPVVPTRRQRRAVARRPTRASPTSWVERASPHTTSSWSISAEPAHPLHFQLPFLRRWERRRIPAWGRACRSPACVPVGPNSSATPT